MVMRERVLFFNGWGSTAAVWDRVIPPLQASGVSCGMLDWTQALTNPEAAVAADMAQQKLDDSAPAGGAVWLAGWSLGGMLALEAAAALRPAGMVRGLILLGTTARMSAEGDWPGADARTLKAMKLRLRREPAAQMADFAALCFASTDTEAAQDYARRSLTIPPERLQAGLEYLQTKDLRPLLPALQDLPATVLHGAEDRVIPCAAAERLAGLGMRARFACLKNFPHALPQACPEAIIAAVKTALSGA